MESPDAGETEMENLQYEVKYEVKKRAMKGIQRWNTDEISVEQMLEVLDSKNAITGLNKGIISKDGVLRMYKCTRTTMAYLYAKRIVLEDGITTKPLPR